MCDTISEPANKIGQLEPIFDFHMNLASKAADGQFVPNEF
jgi:hypothetical protein